MPRALGLRFSTPLLKPLWEEVREGAILGGPREAPRKGGAALGPSSGTQPRAGRRLPAAGIQGLGRVCGGEPPTRSRRGLGGREGAGASGSPSDGEMWPFTFTLQCQHLNHCLRARAQGCSEPAADKAAPAAAACRGPRAPPSRPPPQDPRKGLAAPSAFLFPCVPFPSFFLLSLSPFSFLWGGSQGPISGTRWPRGPRPNHREPGV